MTPGPWRWIDYPDGRKLLAAPSQAVIHCPDASMTIDEPDARLIAAAPDLLAACRVALQTYRRTLASGNWLGDDEHEAMRILAAALAKAEGGPR